MTERNQSHRGLTWRSLAACLFGMVAIGALTTFADVVEGNIMRFSRHVLAPPVMILFISLSLVSGALFAAMRLRLLNPAEMVCVLYCLMIATPLISDAFWHRVVGVLGTLPRTGDFERIDSLSDKLWPQGPNLAFGALEPGNEDTLVLEGPVVWEEVESAEGVFTTAPVLQSEDQGSSAVRIELPLLKDGRAHLMLNEPYMVSVLLRPENLGPDSVYYCRAYYDESQSFDQELFRSNMASTRNYLHRTGFLRNGAYGVVFPSAVQQRVALEIGLRGRGRVALLDPKVISVSAFEAMYTGRQFVTESESLEMRPNELGVLAVKPDSMWSWKGLKFAVAGYIPVRQWLRPMASWLSFYLLLLLAMFAVASIMRRQWIDSERYPLPLTRIPAALLGEGEETNGPLPAIWKNRLMWAGFAASLFWCLMRIWAIYNPNVANMNISVPLKPYFSDPGWGTTWDGVEFSVSVIFLSLAIFMELNVLISLVIGFYLYRFSLWFAASTGMDAYPEFPYYKHQLIGSFLMYAVVILYISRKHLWRVLQWAIHPDASAESGEAMSYRNALLLFIGCVVGAAIWANWIGLSPFGIMLFLGFLLAVGLVTAKIRAECGTPMSNYFPYYPMLFITMAGGMYVFGAEGFLFCSIASYVFAGQTFFLLPGIQVEQIEMSRRFGVARRHIFAVCVLGIAGGMIIGGWTFLTGVYSIGGDTMGDRAILGEKTHYFREYNREMNLAVSRYFDGDGAVDSGSGFQPAYWGTVYGAGGVAILAALRQLFAGFWFHPMGFIVGPTFMAGMVWGSALTAWAIRLSVLRLGGAASVRTKLLPFFTGAFLGGIAGYIALLCVNGYLYFFQPGIQRAQWFP